MDIMVPIVDDSGLARIVAGQTIAALQPGWAEVAAADADEAVAALDRGGVDAARRPRAAEA